MEQPQKAVSRGTERPRTYGIVNGMKLHYIKFHSAIE